MTSQIKVIIDEVFDQRDVDSALSGDIIPLDQQEMANKVIQGVLQVYSDEISNFKHAIIQLSSSKSNSQLINDRDDFLESLENWAYERWKVLFNGGRLYNDTATAMEFYTDYPLGDFVDKILDWAYETSRFEV